MLPRLLNVPPDVEVRRQMILTRQLDAQDEFEFGRKTTRAALERGRDVPAYISEPAWVDAAAGAMPIEGDPSEVYETTRDGRRRLKTLRGLGDLVAPR